MSNTVTRRISPRALSPQIELFGDWMKTKYILRTIDKTMMVGVMAGQRSAAQKLKRIVRRNIRENGGRIGWAPVSSTYAKYKSSKGYDPTNLYTMTGLYYQNIEVWRSGSRYNVGLKSGVRHQRKGSTLTLAQIARVLESGSTVRNIKARPLWTPSFKQLGGTTKIKSIVLWHIRDHIYKAYKIRPRITI